MKEKKYSNVDKSPTETWLRSNSDFHKNKRIISMTTLRRELNKIY
jgi:hypothetical protein